MGRVDRSAPERFVAGGEALARDDDGRVVFVRGALPGETVVAEVDDGEEGLGAGRRGRRRRCRRPTGSCRRARPGGPAAADAAGSTSSIDAQRAAPVDIVDRRPAPHRPASTAPVVEPVAASSPTGYRTTVRVAAGPPTAVPASGPSAPTTWSPRPTASSPTRRSPRCCPACGSIPASRLTLRMSVATGELERPLGPQRRRRPRAARRHADRVGGGAVHEDVAGRRLRVSMGSFFQSGPQAAELLVATVRGAAPGARRRRRRRRRVLPASGCSPRAPPTRRRASSPSRRRGRPSPTPAHNLAGPRRRRRARRGRRMALAGRRGDRRRPRRPGAAAASVEPGVAALARTAAPVLVLVSCDRRRSAATPSCSPPPATATSAPR